MNKDANFSFLMAVLGFLSIVGVSGIENVDAQAANVNLTKIVEEKFTLNTPDYSPSPGITYKGSSIKQVSVEYESPTSVLISGELIISITPGIENVGAFNSAVWEAMDLLKNQYGFKLQNVMTSGVGSVGNPTTVYILMTK